MKATALAHPPGSPGGAGALEGPGRDLGPGSPAGASGLDARRGPARSLAWRLDAGLAPDHGPLPAARGGSAPWRASAGPSRPANPSWSMATTTWMASRPRPCWCAPWRKLGAEVSFFIPNRFSDGYGLHLDCIAELKATRAPGLLISVDCGVRRVDEVRASTELGLDWVITDHHALGPELPPACAVVHPHLGTTPTGPGGRGCGLQTGPGPPGCRAPPAGPRRGLPGWTPQAGGPRHRGGRHAPGGRECAAGAAGSRCPGREERSRTWRPCCGPRRRRVPSGPRTSPSGWRRG